MITLQFSRKGKIGSHLIRWLTWSEWSHVDIVLHDGYLLGSVIPHGVVVRENELIEYRRYTVDAPNSVIKIAEQEIGKPYDWKGLFGIVFRNRQWGDRNAWICSELVAHCFEKAGFKLINSDTWRITPEDLIKSPLLKEVKDVA